MLIIADYAKPDILWYICNGVDFLSVCDTSKMHGTGSGIVPLLCFSCFDRFGHMAGLAFFQTGWIQFVYFHLFSHYEITSISHIIRLPPVSGEG